MLLEVVPGREGWMRVPSLQIAVFGIMHKRVDPGRCDIGITIEVPIAVEQRIGVPTFPCTVADIVREGIESRGGNIRIAAQIPFVIEQLRPEKDFPFPLQGPKDMLS